MDECGSSSQRVLSIQQFSYPVFSDLKEKSHWENTLETEYGTYFKNARGTDMEKVWNRLLCRSASQCVAQAD